MRVRLLAPVVSLVKRAAEGRWWTERQRSEPGSRLRPSPSAAPAPGDDIQAPSDGVGPLEGRRYAITIADPKLDATELIRAFRRDPNQFSPTEYAVFRQDSDAPMERGDSLVVELPGPWDGPVVVGSVTPDSVELVTRDGHLEAGRIVFSASRISPTMLEFSISSVARSGDRLFDLVYRFLRIGRLVQADMWSRVLEAAVRVSGGVASSKVRISSVVYES